MGSAPAFPKNVAVRVQPAESGVAVWLTFESSHRNNFSYTLFVDAAGRAQVSGEDLLRWFDQERFTFLMDYYDPRTVFTGRVTAEVLSNSELESAMGAFTMFNRHISYPDGYEDKLKAAFARGQDPSRYQIEWEVSTGD
jgi:hypothetical protein